MLEVTFYELNTVEDRQLLFAVIMARYEGKWIFVRHKDRTTWEIPGGHREKNEKINITASRELFEETGAKNFSIIPICIYSVNTGETETFGQLFYADVKSLEKLPDFEMGEIKLLDTLPESLTYPLIQPYLFKKIEEFCTELERN
ncbi:NUDIX domain-containing protein [Desulfitobacterium sp. Sab5]|uniref:NUDIX hydrolase n=1 Tax=Desulfitobacterium nosdiversum TaxID=3375356 RepID=UPI003CF07466